MKCFDEYRSLKHRWENVECNYKLVLRQELKEIYLTEYAYHDSYKLLDMKMGTWRFRADQAECRPKTLSGPNECIPHLMKAQGYILKWRSAGKRHADKAQIGSKARNSIYEVLQWIG